MNREKKELMEHKFEKLSDANKIRYNLGRIISIQLHLFLVVSFSCVLILGYLLMVPFIIKYSGLDRIGMMAIIGSFLVLIASILFWVGVFKLNKSEKALEDFLNKKSKK